MPVDRFRAMSYAPNAFDLAKFGAAALMTMGRGGSASADHISGIGAGSRIRLRSKRSRRGSRRKSFAARVRALAPYKHHTVSDSTAAQQNMTHNTIYSTSLTQKISQGDDNVSRDGDAIVIAAVKVQGSLVTPTASGAYMFRVLLLWSGEEYNVSGSSAGLASTEIFLPSTGGSFMSNAIVNPKAVTVLHDEMVDINSLIASTRDVKDIAFKVNVNQKFPYQSTASIYGKTKNLYLVVIGSVVGGTGGTTDVGQHFMNVDIVFQNA